MEILKTKISLEKRLEKKMDGNKNANKWINDALLERVKNIFEQRYARNLTDIEATSIAENLTRLIEVVILAKVPATVST